MPSRLCPGYEHERRLTGPGRIDVKGAQHSFGGPASMGSDLAALPESGCETQMKGADQQRAGATPLGG
ncbi:hypothetical protein HOP51_05355 [Halomonas sp. MCCC 1A11036]|uniref:Uncharacterized protein n=1 Tax=Billgrantia zhangzhouensis TaxID=2733481 RepID=A0ABS9ADC8_9GAMM|nr:hypothetical protein [Halomonas zhangzhouensis]MCE8019549.1 hypothetical protein [Halomonas zhangzhouensis]